MAEEVTANEREIKLEEFLESCNLGSHKRTALKFDASFRRYYRLENGIGSKILMDSRSESEPLEPFINIGKLLRDNGLSTPKVYQYDLKHRFAIIEDFGNDLYSEYLNNFPEDEDKIYYAAIDVLIKLSQIKPDIPMYRHQKSTLVRGVEICNTYYLENEYPHLMEVWDKNLDLLNYEEDCLSLIDYHAENLFWLANRPSLQKVGIIDFQDAKLGFAAFDLVTILQDCRREISPKKEEKYLHYYLENASPKDEKKFLLDYYLLGMQRNMRLLGLFTRFAKERRDKRYLKYIPLTEEYLKRGREKISEF